MPWRPNGRKGGKREYSIGNILCQPLLNRNEMKSGKIIWQTKRSLPPTPYDFYTAINEWKKERLMQRIFCGRSTNLWVASKKKRMKNGIKENNDNNKTQLYLVSIYGMLKMATFIFCSILLFLLFIYFKWLHLCQLIISCVRGGEGVRTSLATVRLLNMDKEMWGQCI